MVGDVTTTERVNDLFERLGPHLVFHAAAYKHVPLMEFHASEADFNNIGGTLSVARAVTRAVAAGALLALVLNSSQA